MDRTIGQRLPGATAEPIGTVAGPTSSVPAGDPPVGPVDEPIHGPTPGTEPVAVPMTALPQTGEAGVVPTSDLPVTGTFTPALAGSGLAAVVIGVVLLRWVTRPRAAASIAGSVSGARREGQASSGTRR